MKLFTNTLLCLTLTCLITEPKLRLRRDFFAKQMGKKKLLFFLFFSNQPRTIHKKRKKKKNFDHLQSYNLPLQQVKNIYIDLLLRITTPTPSM